MLIIALCKPSLGTLGHVTKILQAKNGQKVDDFEPIYLVNYRCYGFCLNLRLRGTGFVTRDLVQNIIFIVRGQRSTVSGFDEFALQT